MRSRSTCRCGARFSVLLPASAGRRWTRDMRMVQQPALHLPDCFRCKRLCAPAHPNRVPSDHRIPAARMAGRCGQVLSCLPAQWSLSATGAICWRAVAAGSGRERDCPLQRMRPSRTVFFRNPDSVPQRRREQHPDAAGTSVPAAWCLSSDPSTQMPCLRTAYPAADIAPLASFRADARSRITKRHPDRCGASAVLKYSWKDCVSGAAILSWARRRTEVHRCTLKRAPLRKQKQWVGA
jgi:hypothetical protein